MDIRRQIDVEGWCSLPTAVDDDLLDLVAAEVSDDDYECRGGVRELFAQSPAALALAWHPEVRRSAEAILGAECFVVRALLFDKTERANWNVGWHQDLTIAVRERCDAAGFGPWSVKAGVPHVQPPAAVLERMLAVRVHLDDCGSENGPLRALPGSHRSGKLSAETIESWKQRVAATTCSAPRGGILAFRPLLLHASSSSAKPQRRRVVHFEFAIDELPAGPAWHARIGSLPSGVGNV
jgi:ectoine hydroxylase-related dioxygenase (phytanoyl-CoA dioxygenase family)